MKIENNYGEKLYVAVHKALMILTASTQEAIKSNLHHNKHKLYQFLLFT